MVDRIAEYYALRQKNDLTTDISMLDEHQQHVLHTAINKDWGNPRYKMRYFIGQAQITDYAMFKQFMIEVASREESIEKVEYDLAKWAVDLERHEYVRDNSTDQFDKKFAEVEIRKLARDIERTKKKLQDWYLDRQQFIDLIDEFLASEAAKLPDGTGRTYLDIMNSSEQDKYERDLWTNRLGKMAALDILFYGRIGVGAMDAILQMPTDQQAETLTLATSYSMQLQEYQQRLQTDVAGKLQMNQTVDTKDLPIPGSLVTSVPKLPDSQLSQGDLDVYNI
jgi:hypothetical protein